VRVRSQLMDLVTGSVPNKLRVVSVRDLTFQRSVPQWTPHCCASADVMRNRGKRRAQRASRRREVVGRRIHRSPLRKVKFRKTQPVFVRPAGTPAGRKVTL
jgi:hypothetical protein